MKQNKDITPEHAKTIMMLRKLYNRTELDMFRRADLPRHMRHSFDVEIEGHLKRFKWLFPQGKIIHGRGGN